MLLSIIIPTLSNTKGLKKLLLYLNRFPYQIIVVDNQPNEEKKQLIKNLKNRLFVYLPQEKNQGFAKAINLGVEKARGEWLLFLNDDINFEIKNPKMTPSGLKSQNSKVKIFSNPFLEMIRFAKKNNLIAVSPILINPDGSVENFGYQVLPYGKINLVKQLGLKIESLDGLTAACLLMKKSVFEKLGGFDERFFAYLEDVDLFLTLKEKGYRFGLHQDFFVLHEHMKTGKTLGWFKNWLDFKNWILLILKHPKKFRFDYHLFLERLRNLSGLIKAVFAQKQSL